MNNIPKFPILGSFDPIAKALDTKRLEPIVAEVIETSIVPNDTDEMNKDFQQIRESLKELVEKGKISFNELSEIASQSQDTDAYLAEASLLNAITNSILRIQKVHESKAKILSSKSEKPTHITNNLNVTSSEILRILKETKKLAE